MEHLPVFEPFRAPVPSVPPLCVSYMPQRVPGFAQRDLSYTPLLTNMGTNHLRAALDAAPHFADLPVEQLLLCHQLRVVLVTEDNYSAAQAALYLASLSALRREDSEPREIWAEDPDELDDLEELCPSGKPDPEFDNALVRVNVALVDPKPAPFVPGQLPKEPQQVALDKLGAAAYLLTSPDGPVLSEGVLDQLRPLEEERETDLFIALGPGQMDRELLEELRFSRDYMVCAVGRPSLDYQRRYLAHVAEEYRLAIAPDIDLAQIIHHTRSLRGAYYTDRDLERLIHKAALRGAKGPLGTEDLLYRPYHHRGERGSWEQLDAMIGLDAVKDKLRRILAAEVWESAHPSAPGQLPRSRSLAFSGNPGTGKSVTARLVARILREEGCGTGKFVEAGREQLIGSFLGQTSPMVASLFQKAKGGVLFIDEAGALLGGDRDIYATEAVNALVRHMELEPETMVIFATYPKEMERLLASNPGLASRVSQVINFPDYSSDELWEIFRSFARQRGVVLSPEAECVCGCFFDTQRMRTGDRFGNAREARRLFQAALEEMALRLQQGGSPAGRMTEADLLAAATASLDPQESAPRKVGF